jgi:hypothetical protein
MAGIAFQAGAALGTMADPGMVGGKYGDEK